MTCLKPPVVGTRLTLNSTDGGLSQIANQLDRAGNLISAENIKKDFWNSVLKPLLTAIAKGPKAATNEANRTSAGYFREKQNGN
jgi:hypothetical protein